MGEVTALAIVVALCGVVALVFLTAAAVVFIETVFLEEDDHE